MVHLRLVSLEHFLLKLILKFIISKNQNKRRNNKVLRKSQSDPKFRTHNQKWLYYPRGSTTMDYGRTTVYHGPTTVYYGPITVLKV